MDDNRQCAAVLADAVNDLGRRNGSIDDGSMLRLDDQWDRWQPSFDHLARTAAEFWVAESDDAGIVGYARSTDRAGLFELTEFFVRPGTQAGGVGGELLRRAFPVERGDLRVIIATTEIPALSRYLRAGVSPRFPIVSFTGPSRNATIDSGIDAEPINRDDLEPMNRIDDEVLGHRREVDHAWLAGEREGFRYVRDGATVGYGYVGVPERAGNGPFAVLDPADLPAVLAHAERRHHDHGAAETTFDVALHNRAAVDHLLGRGYRMDAFMTLLCSSRPFGDFERYVFCTPALIL